MARKRPPPARLSKAFGDKRLCRPMQRRRTAHVFYSGHSGFPTRLDTSAQAGILKGAPEALRYQASCATRACLISRPARVCGETPVRSIWRSPSPAAWRLLAGRGIPRAPYQFMSKRLYAYAAGPWLGGRACLAALAGCGSPSNKQVLPFLHTLTPCRPAGHFPRARRGSLPRLPLAGRGKSHVHRILYTTASLGIAVFASLPMSWGLSGRPCASFQGNIRRPTRLP